MLVPDDIMRFTGNGRTWQPGSPVCHETPTAWVIFVVPISRASSRADTASASSVMGGKTLIPTPQTMTMDTSAGSLILAWLYELMDIVCPSRLGLSGCSPFGYCEYLLPLPRFRILVHDAPEPKGPVAPVDG